jgi:hypothetical protein
VFQGFQILYLNFLAKVIIYGTHKSKVVYVECIRCPYHRYALDLVQGEDTGLVLGV